MKLFTFALFTALVATLSLFSASDALAQTKPGCLIVVKTVNGTKQRVEVCGDKETVLDPATPASQAQGQPPQAQQPAAPTNNTRVESNALFFYLDFRPDSNAQVVGKKIQARIRLLPNNKGAQIVYDEPSDPKTTFRRIKLRSDIDETDYITNDSLWKDILRGAVGGVTGKVLGGVFGPISRGGWYENTGQDERAKREILKALGINGDGEIEYYKMLTEATLEGLPFPYKSYCYFAVASEYDQYKHKQMRVILQKGSEEGGWHKVNNTTQLQPFERTKLQLAAIDSVLEGADFDNWVLEKPVMFDRNK